MTERKSRTRKDEIGEKPTNSVPPKSPEELKKRKREVEGYIDAFLLSIGVPELALNNDGPRIIEKGSAVGQASVVELEGDLYFAVQAPVMTLPSDKDLLLPLMRELLEYNGTSITPAQLGISGQSVKVSIIRQADGLTIDDVSAFIYHVMCVADDLDDQLIEKYGGTSKERKPFSLP